MKRFFLAVTIITAAFQTFADEPESIFNNAKSNNNYWTKHNIENATELELPAINDKEYHSIFNSTSSIKKSEINTESDGVDSPVTELGRPEKADIAKQPFKTAGKLFFVDDSGANKYCSAQYIGNSKTLLTAGHCVRNSANKKWYTKFFFRPQYSNGSSVTGTGWVCATTWSSYTDKVPEWTVNWAKDYAFIQTVNSSKSGYLGYRLNKLTSTITSIGYPSNFENGQYLMRVTGSMKIAKNNVVEMINNPMRSGNSGGAWIEDLSNSNSNGNNIVGINSFHYNNSPESEYSPILDEQFEKLLKFSFNGCSN